MKKFGDLFSESLNEYGSKFVSFLKIFLLLGLVPMLIFSLIALLFVALVFGSAILSGMSISNFSEMENISHAVNLTSDDLAFVPIATLLVLSPLFIISILALIVFFMLMYLGFFYVTFSKKKEVRFKEAFRGGRKYFWRFVGLTIVVSLFLSLLFLALIVPGIIFMIFWLFAPFVLFNENTGVFESMSRSKKIVSGKWWRVFGYFILLMLITMGVSIVLSFVPILGSLAQYIVVVPFTLLFIKNFYLDLKKGKSEKKKSSKKKVRKKR